WTARARAADDRCRTCRVVGWSDQEEREAGRGDAGTDRALDPDGASHDGVTQADRERESRPMQQRSRRREAGAEEARRHAGGQLGPVGMAVEEREERDEGDGADGRNARCESDRDAEYEYRRCN